MRRRLLWSIGLLGLVLCIGFGLMTYTVFFLAEDRTFTRLMEAVAADGEGDAFMLYNGPEAGLPDALRMHTEERPVGLYEVEQVESELHISIRAAADGARHVVLLRVPELPAEEKVVSLGVLLGILFGTLASLALALILSIRFVRPVERLTAWLQRGDPAEPPPDDLPDEELRLLAGALDGYLQQQAGAVNRERAFLREASHELRTPITVVRGVCELAAEDGLSEEGLARISRSVQRMEHTVEGLLSLARQEVTIAPTNFAAEWAAMASEFEEMAGSSCRMEAEIDNPPREPLAIRMLILVIGILLRNVRDHAAASSVSLRLDENGLLLLDDGPGFSGLPEIKAALERQFPLPEGGLGLSIVARICRRMAWDLQLSNLDSGAQVRLSF